MRVETPEHVTRLLKDVHAGDREAIDRLLPLVYDELRDLARQQRYRWQGKPALNTTALVHEAYLRLAGGAAIDWQNRRHFFRIAVKAMRYILLDYARAMQREKRGGGRVPVDLDEAHLVSEEEADELIALNAALERLEAVHPRQSQIVECRFFGGMTVDETAAVLGISPATVKRGWNVARAWLYREIRQDLTA
ncbi:MAG: sigma-70 family RNA polymerase sigma factor [Bacteroidetes bacterium]|nr:hypothetical protein AWN76_014110 [Rhodothermaceae bacterium RA]RMH51631.1 MAG: sigma-70 family RNA polymerase sigma factor [Bacteroidota bacterium]